jgi:hypothetical protein
VSETAVRALTHEEECYLECRELLADLQAAPFAAVADLWDAIEQKWGNDGVRWLARSDRYYLLVRLLNRIDAIHPWLYARCREVEEKPDGYLDLWAREHYKSTIITFAGAIQEILRDPEITIGIFSHTKPTSKKFLVQIKEELETNRTLQELFPDVLYPEPRRHAPRWSEEKGIVVRRKSNPKESTVEAHGLVDGMPTGAHFRLRIYDDVVTLESVNTPEQVKKTTTAWEVSDNLGARSADGRKRAWHVGTRYSFADTYQEIIDRKALHIRQHAATDTGLKDGKPVFLTEEAWADIKMRQSDATLACQQLMNPAAGKQAMFDKDWLKFLDVRPAILNVYILIDPANSLKKDSDNTAMAVIGLDAAGNKFLLDGYRHKMGLRERWECMYGLYKHWRAQAGVQMVKVGYERYGMQADLEYFEEQMLLAKDHFEIKELNWTRDGTRVKEDRVQRLQPDFKMGRFYLAEDCRRKVRVKASDGRELFEADGVTPMMKLEPYETANQKRAREAGQGFRVFKPTSRLDHERNAYSLNKGFLEEYLTFPFSAKKDLIDAISRIYDMEPVPPVIVDERALEPEAFTDGA